MLWNYKLYRGDLYPRNPFDSLIHRYSLRIIYIVFHNHWFLQIFVWVCRLYVPEGCSTWRDSVLFVTKASCIMFHCGNFPSGHKALGTVFHLVSHTLSFYLVGDFTPWHAFLPRILFSTLQPLLIILGYMSEHYKHKIQIKRQFSLSYSFFHCTNRSVVFFIPLAIIYFHIHLWP